MKTLDERFDILEQKMRTESFRQSGTNSGFGYYIFDYDPRDELKVRRRVKDLVNSDTYEKFGYDLKEYDIYELMIQLLKDEDTYDDLPELEESDGTDYVFGCISDTLMFDKKESLIINYIYDHTENKDVIFLTGIGKCYPIIRAHKVINNLFQKMDHNPVIMFFPGKYNGNSLIIFDEIKDDNFYKAIPIVER